MRPSDVVALMRDGKPVPADPGHKPKVGDHLLVAAARDDLGPVIAQIAGFTTKIRDVVLFGAGRVGLPLARRLEEEERFRITLMERDMERARFVAAVGVGLADAEAGGCTRTRRS